MPRDILTAADLAERWQITPDALARRLNKLCLPAVNVGTDKRPDWRFRLAAVEEWERANEATLGDTAIEPAPIPVARPATVTTDFFTRPRRSRPTA